MSRSILLAATAAALLLAATAPAAGAPASVADALATTKDLSALSGILSKFPDLEAKLGDGFTGTVLAPNNKAIAALRSAAAKAGLKLTNKVLEEILSYAVVPTVYELRDLQDGWELPTLQGQPVTIKYGPDGATFLGAGSSAAIADGAQQIDVRTGNGNAVIHTLDTVLLPFALPGGASLGSGSGPGTVSAASLPDGALTNVVGNAEGAEQGVAGAVGSAQQAAGDAAGAAADAAAGAAESATGAAAAAAEGAAEAVEGAAGAAEDAVDDAFNAVAGLGAPELVEGAASPSAAPGPAPLPLEALAPGAAPAALPAAPRSAAAASLPTAVLAVLALALLAA